MKDQLNIAIYAIDDDAGTRVTLNAIFKQNNIYNYTIYSDPVALLDALHEGVQVCVIDYELNDPDYNGISLMKKILEQNSYCKCIIMSGYEDASIIKGFLNNGAFRYVTKGEGNFAEHLIKYVKTALDEIFETFDFYTTLSKNMKGTIEDLKELKNG